MDRWIGDKTGKKHKIGSNHDTTVVSVMGQDDSSLSHDRSCGGLELLFVAMKLLSGLQPSVVSNQKQTVCHHYSSKSSWKSHK